MNIERKIKIYDPEGNEWDALIDYEKICVRRGSFSSAALDPEEYEGIFRYELRTVFWVEFDPPMDATKNPDDHPWMLLEGDDVPWWVEDACTEWVEDLC